MNGHAVHPGRLGRPRPLGGFTLVEAVAAITIIATLGVLTSGLVLRATEGYRRGATQAGLHASASSALEPVFRAVSAVRARSPGAPDLVSLTGTTLAWNGDSGVGSLSLSGDGLLLSADGEPATVLAANATALAIRGFDENGNDLGAPLSGASLDAVRLVEITLTCAEGGFTETLRTRVFIRSMSLGGGS